MMGNLDHEPDQPLVLSLRSLRVSPVFGSEPPQSKGPRAPTAVALPTRGSHEVLDQSGPTTGPYLRQLKRLGLNPGRPKAMGSICFMILVPGIRESSGIRDQMKKQSERILRVQHKHHHQSQTNDLENKRTNKQTNKPNQTKPNQTKQTNQTKQNKTNKQRSHECVLK